MSARIRFPELQTLARERGYGVGRRGREVLWWRNEDQKTTYTSSGVADAWEDIMFDHCSEKPLVAGMDSATGERT